MQNLINVNLNAIALELAILLIDVSVDFGPYFDIGFSNLNRNFPIECTFIFENIAYQKNAGGIATRTSIPNQSGICSRVRTCMYNTHTRLALYG